jgi:hypothetical protein
MDVDVDQAALDLELDRTDDRDCADGAVGGDADEDAGDRLGCGCAA